MRNEEVEQGAIGEEKRMKCERSPFEDNLNNVILITIFLKGTSGNQDYVIPAFMHSS